MSIFLETMEFLSFWIPYFPLREVDVNDYFTHSGFLNKEKAP